MKNAPSVKGLNKFALAEKKNSNGEPELFVELPKDLKTGFKTSKCNHMVKKDLNKDNRTFMIVGGTGAATMAAQTLREDGFTGQIMLISEEDVLPYDRATLSNNAIKINTDSISIRDKDFFDE